MQKEWWQNPEPRKKTISLGKHTAIFDESTGQLILLDTMDNISLDADETYHLLVWLFDNYRDRLYQHTHKEEV